MHEFRSSHVRDGGAIVSAVFSYRSPGIPLEAMFSPRFFPVSLRLRPGEITLLSGSDGWCWAEVESLDELGHPRLRREALAAPAPTIGRKAA